MVPRIGSQGRSFKSAALYYLHDKDALTAERVTFTHTENIGTDDPEAAWRFMAYTALNADKLKRQSGAGMTGTGSEKPVWTLSLSWHTDDQPDDEHMIASLNAALAAVGLKHHQTLMVGHGDRAHRHVHAMVNLVHPVTGKTAPLKFTKEKLSRWAEAYEREHKIYCQQRIENNRQRAQERKRLKDHWQQERRREDGTPGYQKTRPPEKAKFARGSKDQELDIKAEITRRYFASDSGKAFQSAVEELGFRLAQGDRILLVDPAGKIHSITRQIDGVKARDVRAKLADLGRLPDVDSVRQELALGGDREKQQHARRADDEAYFDRDRQTREQDERMIDAAIAADEDKRSRGRGKSGRTGKGSEERTRKARPLSVRLDELQRQREEALSELQTQRVSARAIKEAEWFKTYGERAIALRKDIRRREVKRENTGPVRKFVKTVTGAWQREQEELTVQRANLENVEARQREAVGAFENDTSRQIEALNASFDQQRHQLEASPPTREAYTRNGPGLEFDKAAARPRAGASREGSARTRVSPTRSGGGDGPSRAL